MRRAFLGITVVAWAILGAGMMVVAMLRRGSEPRVRQADVDGGSTG